MSFDYYQSVIGKMRKGTVDDSFIDVNETLQVVNSKVVLSEIPDKFNGLVVKTVFGNTTLVEIKKGTPAENQYLCDYNLGVVHFPETVNNERYVFSYKGRGSVYLAAERIYTKQMNSEEIIQTLRDVLDEADSIINLSERFTNTGAYSATKVYYGRNIVTYDNAAYMCINNSADGIINIPPTNTTHWMQMVSVKQAIEAANSAAVSANTAATNANTATTNANNAADYANEQGDYAKGIRDNFGHKGDYSPTATYKNGNVVTYGGINYFCIQDTTAGIDPLNGAYWTVVSPQASINDETWTSTEGQTVFTITNGNYVPDQGNIEVWVGGVPQVSGVGYTETNNTTITLSEGVTAGTTVFAKWYEGHMSISKGHKSSHALGGQDEIDLTQMRNYKEKVSDEFDRVDAQLAETTTELSDVLNSDKVSKKVTLTNTDVTSDLNTTLADYKSRKLRYAYFDKDTEIQLNSALTQNDVLLMGKTKIGKIHENNAFLFIPNSLKSYGGKANQNFCKFTQLKSAIAAARPVNVTIWGDSISTNGDLLNANTSTVSGTEHGADNVTEGDSYTSNLYDMFAEVMPDKAINFHNRAIGGTWLGEWNALKTINSVEKTWIEHIKDTSPDVLVIAFGMNHNTYDRARSFAYNIKQVTDYINANFTIKPDLIFLTAPRATYHPENSWGSFQEQASRQMTANIFRNVASKYRAYLIDVNRMSNIKRVGTDWLNPTFKEIDPTPYIAKTKDASNNYVFSGSVSLMDLMKYTKDFVLKFTVTFSGHAVSGDNLNISYCKTQASGFNNNQLTITPTNSTLNKTVIQSLANIADNANWGSGGQTAVKELSPLESVLYLRIEKRGNILEVHREVNGVAQGLLLRDKLNVWDTTGYITIRHNGTTAGFTTTISNFRLFEPIYNEYLPSLTEEEAWGAFNPSDTTLKTPFGGNGVNHPSSYGLKEMYLPCIEEFVSDVREVYRNS